MGLTSVHGLAVAGPESASPSGLPDPVWASELNASSGTVVADTSPSPIDGTLVRPGSAVWRPGGEDGLEFLLPSTEADLPVVDIVDSGSTKLDVTTELTVACWIMTYRRYDYVLPPGFNFALGRFYLISKDGAWELRADWNRLNLVTNNSFTAARSCDKGAPLGVWVHWTATWDTAADEIRYYRNGVLVNTAAFVAGSIVTNNNNIGLGSRASATTVNLFGRMRQPRIFDVALSLEEIEVLAGTPPTPIINRAPVARFTISGSNFDATGSFAVDGTISSYDWDFGDGTTATGSTPTHSHSAGEYHVRLIVTDSNGNIDVVGKPVRINDTSSADTVVTITSGSGSGTYANPSTAFALADAPGGGNIFSVWTGDTSAIASGFTSSDPYIQIDVGASAISLTATYVADTRGAPPIFHGFTQAYDDDWDNQANWLVGSVRAVPRSGDSVEIGNDGTTPQVTETTAAINVVTCEVSEALRTAGSRIVINGNFTSTGLQPTAGVILGKDEEGIIVQMSGTVDINHLGIGGPWQVSKGLYYLRGGTLTVNNDLTVGQDRGIGDDNEADCALVQDGGTMTISGVTDLASQFTALPSYIRLRAGIADFADLFTIYDGGILIVDPGMTSVDIEEFTVQSGGTVKCTGATVQQINSDAAITFESGSIIDMSDCSATGGPHTLFSTSGSVTDNGLVVVGAGWSHAVTLTSISVTRA